MTGEVTMYKFNEFLKGFSPMNQILDKVSTLLNKPYILVFYYRLHHHLSRLANWHYSDGFMAS